MKWTPVLFKGDMVRAILDGSKVQTRRPIKPRHGNRVDFTSCGTVVHVTGAPDDVGEPVPYPWQPGDMLWVRETWQVATGREVGDLGAAVRYRADNELRACWMFPTSRLPLGLTWDHHWRPSIHMPRWASRITLLVTSVRAERVQDITDDDALREGIHPLACDVGESPRVLFRQLWERTYGAGAWDRNDGVWVIDFQRVEQ